MSKLEMKATKGTVTELTNSETLKVLQGLFDANISGEVTTLREALKPLGRLERAIRELRVMRGEIASVTLGKTVYVRKVDFGRAPAGQARESLHPHQR